MKKPWTGPLPTAAQINRWIADRQKEGATLKIESHDNDGSLMSFHCAHDEDGVLYDWFPAESAESDESTGDSTPVNRQRRRNWRLKRMAQVSGFDSVDAMAKAINSGTHRVVRITEEIA